MTERPASLAAPHASSVPTASHPGVRAGTGDTTGLGVLRAVITVMVVLHHAVIGYHPYAPPPFDSLRTYPFWQAFPVVDPDRWSGALWIVAFNDTFFMSLMFLISGLFVWHSLSRKGAARYLGGRVRRLGLPFIAGAALLAPLAYLPSYLQTGAAASWSGFWHEWLALDAWPAGPAWFLWLLLAFNAIAVGLYAVAPGWIDRLGRLFANRRPLAAFAILVAASAAAYAPMALAFGPIRWSALGPFAFQTSRVIHYAVYFGAGIAIGAAGIDRSLVAHGGKLAARWLIWVLAAAVAFGLAIKLTLQDLTSGGATAWQLADALGFVVACAALCFAFLAGFVRASWARSRIADSLCGNAFAIYVVHYPFVSWVQYALLGAALPGAVKAALAFTGALALSWLTAAGIRCAWRGQPAA